MKIPKINLPKKPTYLKLAEDIDFYNLFQKIESQLETCFLLESLGEHSQFSRYSIIGFNPMQIIRAKQNQLIVNDKSYQTKNPYYKLRQLLPQDTITRHYAGGLVGYLSYEAANFFEQNINIKVHPLFDQFQFGFYQDGLVLDRMTNEVSYFYYLNNRINLVKKIIKSKLNLNDVKVKFIKDSLTKKQYVKVVEKVKQEIRAGNTFQCQVGFKSEYQVKGSSLKIYTNLRKINPSPHMFYLKFNHQKIIGASPELLLRMRNGEMETFPLAGTIKRGKNKLQDQKLARKLLNDPKEIAEHNMLVDLHRNDLGRVAQFGTVKIRSLMDVKKFSHVQHISSEITGVIRRDQDMFSTLASNFPTGTLSGAPKIESIKIINSLEPEARGPYGGAVGHFGFNGDCTFAIPIRTLFISGDYAYTQTSGGIVYDSKPNIEYYEIQKKLQAMKEALEI